MNTKKLWLTMLVVLSLGLSMSVATADGSADTGDIVINEIMYAPTAAYGGQYNEWIELYNNDTNAINITGWKICDKTISPNTTMQPCDYVIIARNDTKFVEYYPDAACTVIKVAIGSLSNDGEIINLNDSSSTVISSVNYTECADAGMAKTNKTLERNATGGLEESCVDGGTPCDVNSVSAVDTAAPYTTGHDPAIDATDVQIDTNITIHVLDDGTGVNESTIVMTVNGAVVTPDITGTPADCIVTYDPADDFGYDQLVNVTIDATDLNETPNAMATDEYSFTTEPAPTPAGTVSISDGSADAGATTTVTITADAVTDLANFDITLAYDPAVVTVTAADNGGFGDMNNLENAANGTVNLLSFSTGSGQTGDGVLLSTLTLEAVGTATAGQTSALTLTINELLDSAENTIDATPDDGVFDVTGVTDTAAPYTTGHDPAIDATDVQIDTNITIHVLDDGTGVNESTIVMTVNGAVVTPDITGTPADCIVTYDPADDFGYDQLVNVTIDATDLNETPNAMATDEYSFTTEPAPTPAGTVSISDGSADAGATTTVTITADAVTDLANFDITLAYDPAVVTVTAADNGGFGDMNNLENAANGTVNLLSFSTGSGQTGDGVLLSTLTLEAVGTATAGQTSALTLTINELLDSAENTIDATTDDGLFTVNESATLPLTVIADPTNVTENTATEVTFTVTSDDSAVDGALVTLLGCGVDVNGTTGADGTVTISVTATDVGAIDVTTTKDGYDDATTSLDVLSGDIPPVILSATLSPNAILSNGADSTTLTVQASSSIGIASVTVDLSAIGGPDKQSLAGTQMGGTGTWTTTFNATSDGTFDLTVTVTDDNDNLATADVTLTAGPYKYTLELKQGWNMISLPYNIAAVGIDTTQKLGDLITNAGVPCYYVAWFNATSQMMEPDLIGEPDDTTYPIVGGQAYFVFVGTGNDVAVVGTLW